MRAPEATAMLTQTMTQDERLPSPLSLEKGLSGRCWLTWNQGSGRAHVRGRRHVHAAMTKTNDPIALAVAGAWPSDGSSAPGTQGGCTPAAASLTQAMTKTTNPMPSR